MRRLPSGAPSPVLPPPPVPFALIAQYAELETSIARVIAGLRRTLQEPRTETKKP